jgi:CoA:oxalate CoA-transferase
MEKALREIRVIDLSHVLAAPTTTMFLADLGRRGDPSGTPQGDDAREYGAPSPESRARTAAAISSA